MGESQSLITASSTETASCPAVTVTPTQAPPTLLPCASGVRKEVCFKDNCVSTHTNPINGANWTKIGDGASTCCGDSNQLCHVCCQPGDATTHAPTFAPTFAPTPKVAVTVPTPAPAVTSVTVPTVITTTAAADSSGNSSSLPWWALLLLALVLLCCLGGCLAMMMGGKKKKKTTKRPKKSRPQRPVEETMPLAEEPRAAEPVVEYAPQPQMSYVMVPQETVVAQPTMVAPPVMMSPPQSMTYVQEAPRMTFVQPQETIVAPPVMQSPPVSHVQEPQRVTYAQAQPVQTVAAPMQIMSPGVVQQGFPNM